MSYRKRRFLSLLSDSSQEVTDTEMQDAYGRICQAHSRLLAIQKITPTSFGC